MQKLCAWCDRMNPDTEMFCECGHEANRPRALCNCPMCAHDKATNDPHAAILANLANLANGDSQPRDGRTA